MELCHLRRLRTPLLGTEEGIFVYYLDSVVRVRPLRKIRHLEKVGIILAEFEKTIHKFFTANVLTGHSPAGYQH